MTDLQSQQHQRGGDRGHQEQSLALAAPIAEAARIAAPVVTPRRTCRSLNPARAGVVVVVSASMFPQLAGSSDAQCPRPLCSPPVVRV
jgi:hypothetical protein